MEIFVFDRNCSLLGIVEAFEYLRWTRRYSACGSFELKAAFTQNNIDILQRGNILWKTDDEEAGIIESLTLTMQEQETVTVSGRFATSLLARRIVWGTELLQGELASEVAGLLTRHIIAPAMEERRMEGIQFSAPSLGISVNTQISYKNLLSVVEGFCDACDVGIKTVFSPSDRSFTVRLYQGEQTPAVFSREYENIVEQTFSQSEKDFSSVALVGGEGEGAGRTMVIVGTEAGLDRYELFVDAKDLKSADFGGTYMDALALRGQSKLSERALASSFDASIHPYGNLKYKTDFDIGDIVSVVSKRWGITLQTRITEIEESYDRDGLSLRAVLGRGALTLAQKLKGFNMEKSGFFNSSGGDRVYNATDFAGYFSKLVSNGIFTMEATNLQVVSAGGMSIQVLAGSAWINGYCYENTSELQLTLEMANGVNPRIDRVVLRLTSEERRMYLVVKTGVALAAPVATELTRTSDVYELGLADIAVARGVVTIAADNITDTRLSSTLCGTVNSLVSAVYE